MSHRTLFVFEGAGMYASYSPHGDLTKMVRVADDHNRHSWQSRGDGLGTGVWWDEARIRGLVEEYLSNDDISIEVWGSRIVASGTPECTEGRLTLSVSLAIPDIGRIPRLFAGGFLCALDFKTDCVREWLGAPSDNRRDYLGEHGIPTLLWLDVSDAPREDSLLWHMGNMAGFRAPIYAGVISLQDARDALIAAWNDVSGFDEQLSGDKR